MKKRFKKEIIIAFILGAVLTGGIGAYATYNYFASDITYSKNGTNIRVSDALNELYTKVPNGTIEINEISNQINVGSYQYADTTSLYTQDQIQAATQSMGDLELVANLTTATSGRGPSVTVSFTGEKEQEYYLVGLYLCTSGNGDIKTCNIEGTSIVNRVTVSNATIIEENNALYYTKIKASNNGNITITINTSTSTHVNHRGRLMLKVYK